MFQSLDFWLLKIAGKIKHLCIRYFRLFSFSADIYISKYLHSNGKTLYFNVPNAEKKPYLCVFSHFDPHNQVDPYVIHYLSELAKAQCEIVFVTTSTELSAHEQEKIAPFCAKIIIKDNRGRDFGAYRCGLQAAGDLSRYEKVILANDSVYGPFFNVSHLIHYGDKNQLDMWGATNSLENGYHIQSYFVVFTKLLVASKYFSQFWHQVYNLKQRWNIVNRYEIGMSRFFLKCGFKLGALCDFSTIKNDLLVNPAVKTNTFFHINDYVGFFHDKPRVNPTHFLWDVLIVRYQYPFIKRELLMYNPEKLNILNWTNLLHYHVSYNIELIVNHLDRIAYPTKFKGYK